MNFIRIFHLAQKLQLMNEKTKHNVLDVMATPDVYCQWTCFSQSDISKEIEFPDQLISFIGPKSWLLFNLLNLHDEQLDWMQAPIDCWENMVGYKKIEGIVRSLEVVNDCAERAVKLISDFKDVVVNVSDQEYLFQVVQ